jgi:hypothetical protein
VAEDLKKQPVFFFVDVDPSKIDPEILDCWKVNRNWGRERKGKRKTLKERRWDEKAEETWETSEETGKEIERREK